jgi:hypothetical protein
MSDGENDGRWDQDATVHDRVREAAERRAAVRAEDDGRAPDPCDRLRRCFDDPPKDAA